MLELKEKMTHKEAETNASIKEFSVKFETMNAEFIEERRKRWVITFAFKNHNQFYLRRIIITLFYINMFHEYE